MAEDTKYFSDEVLVSYDLSFAELEKIEKALENPENEKISEINATKQVANVRILYISDLFRICNL